MRGQYCPLPRTGVRHREEGGRGRGGGLKRRAEGGGDGCTCALAWEAVKLIPMAHSMKLLCACALPRGRAAGTNCRARAGGAGAEHARGTHARTHRPRPGAARPSAPGQGFLPAAHIRMHTHRHARTHVPTHTHRSIHATHPPTQKTHTHARDMTREPVPAPGRSRQGWARRP